MSARRKSQRLSLRANAVEQPPVPPPKRKIPRLLAKLSRIAQVQNNLLHQLHQLENNLPLVDFDPEAAAINSSVSFKRWASPRNLYENVMYSDGSRPDRKTKRQVQGQVEAIDRQAEPPRQMAPQSPPPRRIQRGQTKRARQSSPQNEHDSHLDKKAKPDPKPEPESEPELEPEPEPEPEQDSSLRRQLTLRLGPPEPTITHPIHLTYQKYGGDIAALLKDYIMLEDQEMEQVKYQQYVREQANAQRLVDAARATGRLALLLEFGAGREPLVPKFVDPNFGFGHHHFLLNAAVAMGKSRLNHRKTFLSAARRNAQAVDQYFRRLAGAEKKDKKEQERQLKQLARRVAQEVQKKWKLAEKVVMQRRQSKLDEENRIKGKQYLNEILEKSARLLESRVAGTKDHPPESVSVTSGSESESESDSDRFSDSDGEDEQDDLDTEDMQLTTEEFQKKYQNLTPQVQEIKSNTPPEIEMEDAEQEQAHANNTPLPDQESDTLDVNVSGNYEDRNLSDDSQSLSDSTMGSSDIDDSDTGDMNGGSALAMLYNVQPTPDAGSESDYDFEPDQEFQDPQDPQDVQDEEEGSSHLEYPISQDEEQEVQNPESSHELETIEEESAFNGQEPSAEPDESEVLYSRGLHKIEPPHLLRGTLREYQRDGLDWLAGLYNTSSNGILADEMGLGKTIQTIALLAYLACEKEVWGPHLIVVPTSVMLNWEMELKRFLPGFKVLTYYGNPQQRRDKRRGWNKEDTWHVCITSYQLVIQDQAAFKRKRWKYMILDEAHNIKNFRSQRWQALLHFNSERRLLLTGTPLQNNLVELWSLLYFLMPSSKGTQVLPDGFANLDDFQEWFARPVDQMVEEGEQADAEARATISKLHTVLRPYLLRRLKVDVEKQMPGKYEHVVYCRLSKRQRFLYDDFMSRASTKDTLASGNFMSILNCLMQLRKVCNHPDLFDVRPIVTSLALNFSVPTKYKTKAATFLIDDLPYNSVNLDLLGFIFPSRESQPMWLANLIAETSNKKVIQDDMENEDDIEEAPLDLVTLDGWAKYALFRKRINTLNRRKQMIYLNTLRTQRRPLFGADLCKRVQIVNPLSRARLGPGFDWNYMECMHGPEGLIRSIRDREVVLKDIISRYSFVTSPVVCLDTPELFSGPLRKATDFEEIQNDETFHQSQVKLSIAFPDKRLLQYDCGKLQRMAILLRDLISGGHRVLVFTQMTRVLDILEQFLNIHGWRYLRLDGATKVEQRQVLTERFNKDPSIPVFILSTRSGGLGINLTGADTVIFYDSDWNPAMDKQCQDRCHRIGQTRDVHIYRLVSEYTIESNILRKATQKTILDNVVIQEGDFTTNYFSRITVQDLLGENAGRSTSKETLEELSSSTNGPAFGGEPSEKDLEKALAQAEDADDAAAANIAMNEAQMDAQEFSGEGLAEEPKDTQDGTPTEAPVTSQCETPVQEAVIVQDREEEEAEDIGHVDDYMIRVIERGDFASEPA